MPVMSRTLGRSRRDRSRAVCRISVVVAPLLLKLPAVEALCRCLSGACAVAVVLTQWWCARGLGRCVRVCRATQNWDDRQLRLAQRDRGHRWRAAVPPPGLSHVRELLTRSDAGYAVRVAAKGLLRDVPAAQVQLQHRTCKSRT